MLLLLLLHCHTIFSNLSDAIVKIRFQVNELPTGAEDQRLAISQGSPF